ncbi:MAG: ATP-binding protein [bacterium]|nr:ATP-binding protein [bacterium]MCM1375311.1 ATP-binding protein [Muribaculum sp.]MCM1409772.1 ATP-binding protein [Lachnospiraceae bacterium]
MALTKAQYDTISRSYEEKRTRNMRQLMQRRQQIYALLPQYQELEASVGAVSVAHARLLLEGDSGALDDLKQRLAQNAQQRRALLTQAGYPEDYLEPSYECPDCQDTGYIGGEKCHCFRQQEITLLYEQSGIQEMLSRENFDTLSTAYYEGEDLQRFENAVSISHKFVDNFKNSYQNLLFYGTVGTGKSFLSGCIARELLSQGLAVIYFSANGLFENLARYSFDAKAKETLYNFCKDIYNNDLVIIDDLGTEVTNSFVTSQLFSLLNERHLRQKATIISTNLNLEEIRDRYSDRIFSRITSNYSLCKLTGPDIRMYRRRINAKS